MGWSPQPRKWSWRDFLTEGEAAHIEAIDAEAVTVKARLREMSLARNAIYQRAVHRAKYAAGQAPTPRYNEVR